MLKKRRRKREKKEREKKSHKNYKEDIGTKLIKVRCTILDAWGWCTGRTQRDGMGREEGGDFRMGNTCIPVADSF